MEEKESFKKSNIGLICFLVLLLGICVGGFGFFAYDKFFNEASKEENTNIDIETNSESDEKKNVEVLNVTDQLVLDTYKRLRVPVVNCVSTWEFFVGDGITAKDVDEDTAKKLAIDVIRAKKAALGETNIFYKKGDGFTKQELREAVTYLFGESYSYRDAAITGNCPSFEYDTTNEKYLLPNDSACGCTSGSGNMDGILSAKKNGENLEINVGVVFFNRQDGNYYKDYENTQIINDLVKVSHEPGAPAEYSLENMAKGSIYKFTFKKGKDNNYYFVKSELVK